MSDTHNVKKLYEQLISAWNIRDAEGMANQFTVDGEMIGFDGSQELGRETMLSHLAPIFASHPTAPYVTIIKNIAQLSDTVVLLRAIAGMIPPGKAEVNPAVNTHHTVVAVKADDEWKIKLFQNTPAQFHGRPELVEKMTRELNQKQ